MLIKKVYFSCIYISHDMKSQDDKTPCIKIYKTSAVYIIEPQHEISNKVVYVTSRLDMHRIFKKRRAERGFERTP